MRISGLVAFIQYLIEHGARKDARHAHTMAKELPEVGFQISFARN